MFLIFLLAFPIVATAGKTGGEPISKVVESYEIAPRETMKEFSKFVDGFKFGVLAMYRRQKMFAADQGFEFTADDADSEFMSCMLSSDSESAIMYRLIEAAKKRPDKLLFLWLTSDFIEQCGEKMEAAIADQYIAR